MRSPPSFVAEKIETQLNLTDKMSKENSEMTKKDKLAQLFDSTVFKKRVFDCSKWLYSHTFYYWIGSKREENKKYDIAGGYITFFLAILIVSLSIYSFFQNVYLLIFIAFIALYRLYDLIITHFYNIILNQDKGVVKVRHPGRFIVYAIINFIEITICFSVVKLLLEKLNWAFFNATIKGSILDSLYFTIVTLVTLGYGDIHPINPGAKVFVIVEIIYFATFLLFVFPIISSAIKVVEK